MLRKRVITALWGIPLLVVAIWFDEPIPWFTVLVATWGILAALEFYRLVATSKASPLISLGLIWSLLFILSPHFKYDFLTPLLITSAIVSSLISLLLRPHKEGTFINWAWTIAGIFYIGWLLSYMVSLRGLDNPQTVLDEGRNWIFFALFTTFASDSAAFFIGRTLGKHHLAPSISPGKTWEGTIAGFLGAIIVSLLFLTPSPFVLPLNYGQAILIGLLVSIFGQLGDLAESLLKRNMEVKESGNSLPGHGGFLDRIDSVIFAGVVVYYCALAFNAGWF